MEEFFPDNWIFDQWSGSMDTNVTERLQVFGRYIQNHFVEDRSDWTYFIVKGFNNSGPQGTGVIRDDQNGVLDMVCTVTPTTMLHASASVSNWLTQPTVYPYPFQFTYHKPAGSGPGVITLARGRWDGAALVEVRDLFSAVPSGNASRIVFGKDGMVYMTVGTGDPPGAARAQDPNDLAGKVLRLRDDGTVPPDNPFVGHAGYRPEIYTLGHRNALGLAVQPDTGAIWECEDGPNGGDEINVLRPGKNYGWPVVSYGRFYLGPRVSEDPWKEGMEPPLVFWVPAIAISGMTFYTGDRFPTWKNNIFVGGMRQGEVPRSGHLERIDFNEKWEELHRESMLHELQQRIRDVRQGPDGYLYVLTAENEGALLRLEPWTPPGGPALSR